MSMVHREITVREEQIFGSIEHRASFEKKS